MATAVCVLGKTCAEISSSYLQLMPTSLKKETFFEEKCSGIKCLCVKNGKDWKFALEGSWDAVQNAKSILALCLSEWGSIKHAEGVTECGIASPMEKDTCCVDVLVNGSDSAIAVCNKALEDSFVVSPHSDYNISMKHHLVGQSDLALNVTDGEDPRQEEKSSKLLSDLTEDSQLHSVSSDGEEDTNKSNAETDSHPYEKEISQDVSIANEIHMDIQLEHDYNNYSMDEKRVDDNEEAEPCVENEIYMDIKLSKKSENLFEDPNFPVALVVPADKPCVEVLQLNVDKIDSKCSAPRSDAKSCSFEERQERLRLRRKKYEEESPYRFFCTQCSYKTKRQSHMKKHSRLHERVCKIYSCPDCDFSSVRLCTLQRHIVSHKSLDFACAFCPYATHKEDLLLRHNKRQHTSKPDDTEKFQCLKCSYMTTSAKFLERHVAVHLKEESHEKKSKQMKFKCDQCSFKSPSRSNFYRHMASIHGDERPFLCNICGLSFKRSDTLVQHRATHVDEEPDLSFQCSQCKKYYRTEKLLREHQLTHSDERSYLCEVCGTAFKTRAVQRKHFQEVHVRKKPHACQTCGKEFFSRSLVKRHMKTHVSIPERLPSPQLDTGGHLKVPIVRSQQYGRTILPAPTQSDDVQVLIVQQEVPQPDLILNHDTVVVQDGQVLQVTPSMEQGQTLTVPIVPVEYILPENVGPVATADHVTSQGGDYITLTFV